MAELLNSAIADDLSAAGAKAKYDENIRNILSNKSILAWILKYTTDEFSEYDIPKIMECIENPEVGNVRIRPGLTLTMLPASLSPFLVVLISILVAALAGVIYSLLLAFASINLKADQTIGGTALNLLATAIAVVISKYFSESGSAKLNYSNKPFLFSIGGLELSVFVPLGLILLVVSYIVLYKTRFGLRLRACGEHPQAADSVGINVYKMRYAGVILSGALGAIGGLAYIVPPVQTWNFEVGVAGAGFLALAVMIFGQWKPFHIFGAAMFFAVFKSLANIADSTFLAQLHWSSNIYNMMPFVASMVILAFTSKNSMAPKAEGIPYDKGSR